MCTFFSVYFSLWFSPGHCKPQLLFYECAVRSDLVAHPGLSISEGGDAESTPLIMDSCASLQLYPVCLMYLTIIIRRIHVKDCVSSLQLTI